MNRQLLRKVGREFENFPPAARFDVLATDVMIVENGGMYVFVATHEPSEVSAAMGGLRAAAGSGNDWVVGSLPKIEPSSDMYLWMLHRWHNFNGNLSPTLSIVEFNTLSTRDSQGHLIRSLRGIDLARVDTLGAAAEAHDLGPAKFVLYDKQVKIRADLFMLLDGSFDIHRSGTEYDGGPIDKALLGLFATLDIATKVLPRLHNAYAADKNWPDPSRATFVEECRQALEDRFKP